MKEMWMFLNLNITKFLDKDMHIVIYQVLWMEVYIQSIYRYSVVPITYKGYEYVA